MTQQHGAAICETCVHDEGDDRCEEALKRGLSGGWPRRGGRIREKQCPRYEEKPQEAP